MSHINYYEPNLNHPNNISSGGTTNLPVWNTQLPKDWLVKTPDGGPAEYYDLPPNPKTLNDLLEYKGDKHWLGDSFHLSNIVKAAWRWGIKSGVDKAYDARKFIYSGVRLLLKYQGLEETRATLQKLLDDPQFGGK